MLAIFWRTIKDRKISLLIYCLSGIGLLFMYAGIFPAMQDQAEEFNKLLENYPESFLAAFDVSANVFSTIEGFLAVEQFSFVWPLMMMFMMIGLAAGAISGGIERGTIELPLARPISRAKYFLGQYLAGAFNLLVFTLVSILAAIPVAEIIGIEYQASNYFKMSLMSFLFGLAVLSMSFLFSALFSERSKTYAISAGILVGTYILDLVAKLKESLGNLKYLSFFHYYDASGTLVEGTLDELAIVAFVAFSIFCFCLALVRFIKRDITV